MSKPSVFLSFASRDSDLAGKVERALEQLGLAAFNPSREISPGEDWRKAVQAAIKRADALILLFATPPSAGTTWMAYEAGMAEALGKRVMLLVPYRYPVTELPADLAGAQIVGFDPQAPERAARAIVDRLATAA